MNATLNEDTLAHIYRGGGGGGVEHGNTHVLQSVDLHALSDMQSLKTSNADSFKTSRQEYVVSQIILSARAVHPD